MTIELFPSPFQIGGKPSFFPLPLAKKTPFSCLSHPLPAKKATMVYLPKSHNRYPAFYYVLRWAWDNKSAHFSCKTISILVETAAWMLNILHMLFILGRVRSLSTSLWSLTHLTALHLNDNYLTRIPPDIAKLHNLVYLDLSSNKLRSLPAELGNMVSLRWGVSLPLRK